jgi:hypothetical protein
VITFFGSGGDFRAIFFNGVFELPLSRNAQKRDKKNRTKQPREGKKKRRKKKPHFL